MMNIFSRCQQNGDEIGLLGKAVGEVSWMKVTKRVFRGRQTSLQIYAVGAKV